MMSAPVEVPDWLGKNCADAAEKVREILIVLKSRHCHYLETIEKETSHFPASLEGRMACAVWCLSCLVAVV